MKKSNIHLINLGILAAYMILLTIGSGGEVLLTSMMPIGLHVFVNLILFIVNFSNQNTRSVAYTYLLSAFFVLLVGFSSCWALSSLAGGARI